MSLETVQMETQAGGSQSGASLVTTLLLMISLSVLGITAITATRTNTQIATNDNLQKQLLVAAEAGLEAGRRDLILQETWVGLLNAAVLEPPTVVPGMHGVNYRYQFVDDADDLDPLVDSNGVLIIRSYGLLDDDPASQPPYDAQVVLEAAYFRAQAGADYAQENGDELNSNTTSTDENVDFASTGTF